MKGQRDTVGQEVLFNFSGPLKERAYNGRPLVVDDYQDINVGLGSETATLSRTEP